MEAKPHTKVKICANFDVLNFFMAGTTFIDTTGRINRIAAIIGAPIVSIIPKMLGLRIVTIHVVITINSIDAISIFFTEKEERDLINPTKPS